MQVEYGFPTSLDGPTALRQAGELLAPLGFLVEPPDPIPLPKGHFEVVLRRGSKWRRPTDIRRWQHEVRVEWYEGRVTIGASLPPARNGMSTQGRKLSVWQSESIQRMLTEFAESIEKQLDGRWTAEVARTSLEAMEHQIGAEAGQRSRIRTGILLFVFILVATAAGIAVHARH